jgi:cytochrome P450
VAELRADRSLIPSFIEEALRIESPVQATPRVTTAPGKVGDEDIPLGEVVALLWGAANQDPDVFENPRTFDMHRPNVKKHLAFGHGPHFCPGSNLSRAEVRIAIDIMLDRMNDLRLAEGHCLSRSYGGWDERTPVD